MFWLQYIVSLKKIKIQNKNCEIKHAIWSSGVVKHHMEKNKTLLLCFFFNHNKNNQKKIDNVIVSKFDKLNMGRLQKQTFYIFCKLNKHNKYNWENKQICKTNKLTRTHKGVTTKVSQMKTFFFIVHCLLQVSATCS